MNIQGQAALVTGRRIGPLATTRANPARLGKVAVLDINLANELKVAADIGGMAFAQ